MFSDDIALSLNPWASGGLAASFDHGALAANLEVEHHGDLQLDMFDDGVNGVLPKCFDTRDSNSAPLTTAEERLRNGFKDGVAASTLIVLIVGLVAYSPL